MDPEVSSTEAMLALTQDSVLDASAVDSRSSPVLHPGGESTASAPSSVQSTTVSAATGTAKKSKKKKSGVSMATSGAGGAHGENTGRWTAEEHRLFLQGLEQHGKGWKKIASLIKSRTVVQIRTHAQKYFQKLAKARQNGEDGDVSMEGRGGTAMAGSSPSAQANKRRRSISGTKRKAIQSVVASAQRQGKKGAKTPAVAPALSHYVIPAARAHQAHPSDPNNVGCIPSITSSHGTVAGPALEDSLFRFLTPAPVQNTDANVSEVARQAGANPITLPTDSHVPSLSGGDISPTGVAEMALYPSWTDAKDTPSWYAKGSDVDALLDVADTLDWLTDTGDLHETYQPSTAPGHGMSADVPDDSGAFEESLSKSLGNAPSATNMSLNTLSAVDTDVVVPPLPSLFEGAADDAEVAVVDDAGEQSGMGGIEDLVSGAKGQTLSHSPSAAAMDDHLQVFDNPAEEHEFVSTILETNESTASLPALT